MRLEIFERMPHVVEHIEIIADTGDRFEMRFLNHLLNKEFVLLPNDCGAYSIFALPITEKIAKQLGRMKTGRKHLSAYNRESPPWNEEERG
jgi:hypothetical protein